MRIALLGTRGVPAQYGGFETAVEEVGSRLAAAGHAVTVYCRSAPDGLRRESHRGMRLVHLPAVRHRALETLSHTALSAAHASLAGGHDAAVVFNAANAPFVPVLQARGVPVAVHVDGLEWKRGKWGRAGRAYYQAAEALSVRLADALIADAQGIAEHYLERFGAPTELITYGAPILRDASDSGLAPLGLSSRGFHLVVARFEPENHVHLAVEGYVRSAARLPLVVVGSAPYNDGYRARVHRAAGGDPRVHLLGPVWDQELLDQLYAHCLTYVHGHSVGGTNPSLLRAMGAGAAVIAYDVGFNREVAGPDGRYFAAAADLAQHLATVERAPQETVRAGAALRERAATRYRWDDVAAAYEDLCLRLAATSRARRPLRSQPPLLPADQLAPADLR